ncbi:hypothetical protein I3760_05G048600 [Carya illinoinensis]|uniref:Secreted protein n=1 Tax=Carya illinoinensis TaxID=32201 RepID=A0A922JKT7_CARIL|nr:hypothetical protein I3760_05G048600 [Carya illinoinensis]KAG6711338.1 hypothetical protein I3842_05G047800 [Carya illinoinensis]
MLVQCIVLLIIAILSPIRPLPNTCPHTCGLYDSVSMMDNVDLDRLFTYSCIHKIYVIVIRLFLYTQNLWYILRTLLSFGAMPVPVPKLI